VLLAGMGTLSWYSGQSTGYELAWDLALAVGICSCWPHLLDHLGRARE